jgi:hypothetical protein
MFVINILDVISNLSCLTPLTYVPLSTIIQFLHVPLMFWFVPQVGNRCVRPTRVAMYAERNIETHLCNHCCCRKAISVTYSECVYVALVIHPANCIHHIILSHVAPICLYHIFPHISLRARFWEKKIVDCKMLSTTFLCNLPQNITCL